MAEKPTQDPGTTTNLNVGAELGGSQTSIASAASAVSASSNQSGIRPPSRIGRLCGNRNRPAVPASPPNSPKMSNYCDDTEDSLINVYGRHTRLTDVLEETVNDEQDDFLNNRSHHHHHQYRKRSSNSSTILTEDTDSFIIGQRVWVDGTKPGHIAFIGETQFAPGEWAGIALDEPIGKNDGTVSGIHYFMCEPKKGIFARLTRLTRCPINSPQTDLGGFMMYHHHNLGAIRKSPITPSPTEEISHHSSSLLKSPISIGASNTSLASTTATNVDFRIGDRVIIRSGQGSKVGTVRFMGLTEFSTGEYVGVELDEPRGKNDGSINGIRYFQCEPNFGIFAPINKVSKSPSKIKPYQCQVHPLSGKHLGPLKRTGSKESLTSNYSMLSSASTSGAAQRGRKVPSSTNNNNNTTPVSSRIALQDVLKEKQQHIEQLLKERDLERSEIARAAETDQKIALLSQKFNKSQIDFEAKIEEYLQIIKNLKETEEKLKSQLEDEKRKNEDWQFKYEEAAINKSDAEKDFTLSFNVLNQSKDIKIKELEDFLKREEDHRKNAEENAKKLPIAEETIAKLKEMVENLKHELQEHQNKHLALQGDNLTTAVLIKSLQKELDETKQDCDEKSEIINVLKMEISTLQSQCSKIESKFNKAEEEINEKITQLQIMDKEITKINKTLTERDQKIERLQSDHLNLENLKEKELNKFKIELSSKVADIEELTEKISSSEAILNGVKLQFEAVHEELMNKTQEMQNLAQKFEELNELSVKEIETLKNEKSDLEMRLLKQCEENATYSEKIKNLEQELHISLKTQNEFKNNLELNNSREWEELNNNFQATSEENKNLAQKIQELENTLQNKLEEFDHSTSRNNKLIVELKENTKAEIQKNDELITDLKNQLQSTKRDLEAASNDLQEYQNNFSDVEIKLKKERDWLHETLGNKINECDNLKKELLEKENTGQHVLEENAQLKEINESKLKEKSEEMKKFQLKNVELENLVLEKNGQIAELENKLKEIFETRNTEQENLNRTIADFNQLKNNLEFKSKEVEDLKTEFSDFVKDLETELANANKLFDEHMEIINQRDDKILKMKENQRKLNNELMEDHKIKLEELKKDSEELKLIEGLQSLTVSEENNDENEKLRQARTELENKLENMEKMLILEFNNKDAIIVSKNLEIKKLEEKISKVQISSQNALSATTDEGKPEADNNDELLEEKLFADSQIAFLNSIIVDMQKKYEDQKAKIEILEMGYAPQQMGFKSKLNRLPAPRMFCDICDQFDLHETEDCPIQSSDAPPPASALSSASEKNKIAKNIVPREYCEICGVFGHDTLNCPDEEF